VPINFFGGPDGFTDAMAQFAGATLQDTAYKKQYSYTANLTGDLFELPAGPLGFAAGYEYRREFGFDQPDAITASGATTGNARSPTAGGFSLDEFYVEFNVPILKDLAFAEIFEISVAGRWSDYSNFGDTTNPKVGFRWKPFADLLVRGNYSDGFRAPTVSELFLGQSDNFPELQDPCSLSSFAELGVVTQATRDRCLQGVTDANGRLIPGVSPSYEQTNTQIRTTIGGNQNLLPEQATSKTLGLVYSPSWLEGLDVYLDWYNIEITQAIGVLSGQTIAFNCYQGQDAQACTLITRGSSGDIINLFAATQNLTGGTEVEGYDLTLNYRFDTEWGKFNINWDSAYISYYGDVGQDDFLFCRELGVVFSPTDTRICPGSLASGNTVGLYSTFFPNWRLKSNITTTWQYGDWGATLGARYLSALDEDCSIPAGRGRPELCSNPTGSPQNLGGENELDETWYFDLQGTWDTPWNGRVTAGIRNLFDEDPPLAFDAFANTFDPQYDVPGRFWYVQYNQKF
jgi:iron complex outermembrane receptor protein